MTIFVLLLTLLIFEACTVFCNNYSSHRQSLRESCYHESIRNCSRWRDPCEEEDRLLAVTTSFDEGR